MKHEPKWYNVAVNGHRVLAPLTPTQVTRLQNTGKFIQPAEQPADLSERLFTMLARLIDVTPIIAAPEGRAETPDAKLCEVGVGLAARSALPSGVVEVATCGGH
jgi:hypothetical protein